MQDYHIFRSGGNLVKLSSQFCWFLFEEQNLFCCTYSIKCYILIVRPFYGLDVNHKNTDKPSATFRIYNYMYLILETTPKASNHWHGSLHQSAISPQFKIIFLRHATNRYIAWIMLSCYIQHEYITEFDVVAELLSDVSETQFHNTVILVSSKERFWFSAVV